MIDEVDRSQARRVRNGRWLLVLVAGVAVGLVVLVVLSLGGSLHPLTPGPSTAVGPSPTTGSSASPSPTTAPLPIDSALPSPSSAPPIGSPPPSPSTEPADGIPDTWLGAVVLRGPALRDSMATMTDDTAGLAGGYLRYLSRDCVTSPTPFPATHLVQPCDDGWTLVDAPDDDSGVPVAIIAPVSGSWALDAAMIVSVHSHDASAADCPASIASRCDQAIVLDRVVWSADTSNPTGSPTPSPTLPPADPPSHEGRWTRVGGNAIDRFGGFFQLWPTDGALFATAVEGESDDGGAIMTVLSTEDGVRWHVMGRIQQSADYLTSFIRFQGHFVAVSEAEDRAQVWYSEDGADWTWVGDQPSFVFDADGGSSEPPHTELQISRVFAVADHLEIVGTLHCYCGSPGDRMAMWTSADGATWDRVPAAWLQGLPELDSAWVDKGMVFAYGNDLAYTSTDGFAWKRLRVIPDAFILPAPFGYFAVQQYRDEKSRQWVSADLKHWTRVGDIETGVPETDQSYGYAAGFRIATGGIIVAVSGDETKQIIVSWSADGRTWRHEIIHEQYPTHVQDIAVMGHHVVLSGEVDRNADHSQQVLWVADLPTP